MTESGDPGEDRVGSEPPRSKPPISRSVASWSVVGMALGFLLGLVGRFGDLAWTGTLAEWVAPMGALWINALQMTVVPLVVSQLLAAMVLPEGSKPFGKLGGQAVGLFVLLSISVALLSIVVTTGILPFFSVTPGLLDSLPSQSIPALAQAAATQELGEGLSWIVGLVPRNPLQAAADGNILQVLVFTILIGVAAAHLPGAQRAPLAAVFRSLADAMMILVGWVLWGTPVGIFSIMLSLTLGAGLEALSLMVIHFFLVCGVMILATLVLYPVTVFFGRVGLWRFAKACFPSQMVAATTQSSLASLPAMIDGGKKELDFPPETTGFVLPLWVSAFKLNQSSSPIVKVILLAYFFQIPLGLGEISAFTVGSILVGLTSVGIPRGGGGFNRLPLYLAVGIPLEAYFVLEAVKHSPIYDAIATVLNVTGDLTAATILSRGGRGRGDGDPSP